MFLDRPIRHIPRNAGSATPLPVFGMVFVLGLAAGTLIPARGYLPWSGSAASVQPSASPTVPPPSAPMTWSRDGNASVRHAVEVVRVIDGDTFEARVHLWPGLEMTTRVRLRGIDAPEMKSGCAEEFRMAEAATEALRALLANGEVTIFNIGPDKYNGRVVADASTRQIQSVSSALLGSGHARAYQGGRRSGWCTTAAR